jgi:hypothetical protein
VETNAGLVLIDTGYGSEDVRHPYAARGSREHVPTVAEYLSQMARRLDAFFGRYRDDHPERLVVVHGDLVGEHLLMDSLAGRLEGFIDFSDLGLGDPAQEFLGLWRYGADAAPRAVHLYDALGRDPGPLRRSLNDFIRYEIDRLLENRSDRSVLGYTASKPPSTHCFDVPKAFLDINPWRE